MKGFLGLSSNIKSSERLWKCYVPQIVCESIFGVCICYCKGSLGLVQSRRGSRSPEVFAGWHIQYLCSGANGLISYSKWEIAILSKC
jgi:hypothetical protein